MESHLDHHTARTLLEFQIELGAYDAVCDTPVDRYALVDKPKPTPQVASAQPVTAPEIDAVAMARALARAATDPPQNAAEGVAAAQPTPPLKQPLSPLLTLPMLLSWQLVLRPRATIEASGFPCQKTLREGSATELVIKEGSMSWQPVPPAGLGSSVPRVKNTTASTRSGIGCVFGARSSTPTKSNPARCERSPSDLTLVRYRCPRQCCRLGRLSLTRSRTKGSQRGSSQRGRQTPRGYLRSSCGGRGHHTGGWESEARWKQDHQR